MSDVQSIKAPFCANAPSLSLNDREIGPLSSYRSTFKNNNHHHHHHYHHYRSSTSTLTPPPLRPGRSIGFSGPSHGVNLL